MRKVHLMSDSPGSIVRQFLAATHASDVDELAGFFSVDAVYIDGPRGTYNGIDAIRAALEAQVQVTPSLSVDVKTLVVDGTTVFAERIDSFEVQGKWFALEVVGVFVLDDDGKIKRLRDYYDLQSLMDEVAAVFA
jgi:limonene-1,2-epoxide hydrolase